MIKLVIIDVDDTLFLTEEAWFKIENFIAKKMGYRPMARKAHQKNWGMPVKKAIAERIPGIDPDKFMEMHRKLLPSFVKDGKVDIISDKNIKTLKKLKNSGKHLAILTSCTFHEIEHFLDKGHKLNGWIEKFYYADNSKYLKSDPRVFDQILADFNVQPKEAVYISDSISDGESAKGAGIRFIASLESGLRKKRDFKSVSVDFFVDSFPEIISYISKQ